MLNFSRVHIGVRSENNSYILFCFTVPPGGTTNVYRQIAGRSDPRQTKHHDPGSALQSVGHLPETVAEAHGKNRKEARVAEVVIVARFEGGETFLEAGILVNGLAACRDREVGITDAADEGHLQTGLARIVEARLHRYAEVAALARYDVADAETEARRSFAEVDASCAPEGIDVTADVVLAIERKGAAR